MPILALLFMKIMDGSLSSTAFVYHAQTDTQKHTHLTSTIIPNILVGLYKFCLL